MSFRTNVFINCPFDKTFVELLRPLLFTTIFLGFKPRIAYERFDSGETRLDTIVELIRQSRLAIHDISRLQAARKGEYFRLNMPLELGIDMGCRRFGSGRMRNKRCLILESERFRYQAALSDLSGADIGVHEDSPQRLVAVVRNWLRLNGKPQAPGAQLILNRFTKFMAENYQALRNEGHSAAEIRDLNIDELVQRMLVWVDANPR